jgi:hypothetical protein
LQNLLEYRVAQRLTKVDSDALLVAEFEAQGDSIGCSTVRSKIVS